jgi:hypothetical protein
MAIKDKNSEIRDLSKLLISSLSKKFIFNEINHEIPEQVEKEEKEKIFNFFKICLAGLGGSSPTMISSTILVLIDLFVEYSRFIQEIIPDLLNSVLILLQFNNNEVLHSLFTFIKRILSLIDKEYLQKYIPSLSKGIFFFPK